MAALGKKSYKILVCDDDEDIVEYLALESVQLGLEVDFASDGKQALSKVLAHPYTLVVTDYRMPGMNGLELASAIGKAMPSLSVILVTGYPSPEVEGAAGTSNIDSILYKPLDPKRLRGAILTFLEKESRRDTGS